MIMEKNLRTCYIRGRTERINEQQNWNPIYNIELYLIIDTHCESYLMQPDTVTVKTIAVYT